MRLLFNNSITRYGAIRVSLVSFTVECAGLMLIWQASSIWMVDLGAFLTGSGFSLIFPALGVEAIRKVQPQNQGSALGLYAAFLDCGLGITGPVAGLLIGHWGVDSIYLAAAGVVLLAGTIMVRLILRGDR